MPASSLNIRMSEQNMYVSKADAFLSTAKIERSGSKKCIKTFPWNKTFPGRQQKNTLTDASMLPITRRKDLIIFYYTIVISSHIRGINFSYEIKISIKINNLLWFPCPKCYVHQHRYAKALRTGIYVAGGLMFRTIRDCTNHDYSI